MKKLCAMILLGTSVLFAAEAENPIDLTFGLENGHFWNALRPDWRYIFIRGIVHGWRLRGYTEDIMRARTINAMTASGKFSMDDLAKTVASIYADSENIGLPVGWVVLASLAIERGETNRSTVLTALRRQMADLLIGKDTHPNTDKDSRPNTDFDPLDAILASRAK